MSDFTVADYGEERRQHEAQERAMEKKERDAMPAASPHPTDALARALRDIAHGNVPHGFLEGIENESRGAFQERLAGWCQRTAREALAAYAAAVARELATPPGDEYTKAAVALVDGRVRLETASVITDEWDKAYEELGRAKIRVLALAKAREGDGGGGDR